MTTFKSKMLTLIFSLILPVSAFAEDRTANPGEDPNEAKSTNSTEGSVSAIGICNECIARMYGANGKGSRLSDDTTYRPRSGSGSGSDSTTGTAQGVEGTR